MLRRLLPALLLLTAASLHAQVRTVGLFLHDTARSFQGYTLLYGKHIGTTVLIDNQGRVVHRWNSAYEPGQAAYLLEDGSLLRCALPKGQYSIGGGEGGRFELYGWNGDTLWQFDYASNDSMSHHDVAVLPNLPDGRHRFLALAVERKSRLECAAAGFDTTKFLDSYLSPEYVVEFVQNGRNGYEIAWKWRVWDHLIQDEYPDKANYGKPSLHPERIDVNSGTGSMFPSFWNHANSIRYHAGFDQVAVSIRGNSEFWILDHGTTTAQARTDTGGRRGKGGGLLYRWGNPQAYGAGTPNNRRLYQQHDAQWIESGLPGAGHFLVYNNGCDRPGDKYSSLEEVAIPQDSLGDFPTLATGAAFGPVDAYWHYQTPVPTDFYSAEVSGVQRLPNGNTLVCEGVPGHLFELAPNGDIVWDYVNPMVDDSILAQGDTAAIDPRGHPMNALFKVHRYAPDYPGLAGRLLVPGDLLERNPWPAVGISATSASRTGTLRFLTLPDGSLRIDLPASGQFKVVVSDLQGRIRWHGSFSGSQAILPSTALPRGTLVVSTTNEGLHDRRLLVRP